MDAERQATLSLLFGIGALALGAVLLAWHVRAYRATKGAEGRTAELNFARRQFRRRLQASGMMLLLGLAVLAAPLIPTGGLSYILYWAAMLLLALWMILLALADMLASQFHYGRQRDRVQLQRSVLEAKVTRARQQLDQARGTTGNDRASHISELESR